MATVLCVSGDPQVRADVEEALRANGFRCVSATDRPSARAAFQSYLPETLVCDLRLPADLAHELCQYALAAAGVPTIMLGATPDETEELIAFAVGAADYLVWPGSARILAARTRVATRRNAENLSARTGCADIVDFESIVLVRSRRQVSVHSELVHLTRTEFDILALLMDSPHVVWSRPDLVQAVWGQWHGDDHLLEVHISRLRAKILAAGGPAVAQAVRGVGYRLAPRDAVPRALDGRPRLVAPSRAPSPRTRRSCPA